MKDGNYTCNDWIREQRREALQRKADALKADVGRLARRARRRNWWATRGWIAPYAASVVVTAAVLAALYLGLP